MPMLTPVKAAAMEAIKRRVELAIAKAICAGVVVVAVAGTITLAVVELAAVAGMFSREASSRAIFAADASLVASGWAVLALCAGVGIWDMSRAKGWRSQMSWRKPANSVFTVLSAPLWLGFDRMCVMGEGCAQGPNGFAAGRKDDRWTFMPKPMNELNGSIKMALSSAPQVGVRIPLWSMMMLWIFLTFPLLVVSIPFMLLEGWLLDLTLRAKSQGVAPESKKSLRARLAAKIEGLASEAPEAFAKAEAEALSRAVAPKGKSSSSRRM